jgi:hypothetical protein
MKPQQNHQKCTRCLLHIAGGILFANPLSAIAQAPDFEYVGRLGLWQGTEFTRDDGTQDSSILSGVTGNFVYGHSTRYEGSLPNGRAAWMGNVATAQSTRIGLFSSPEFSNSFGYEDSNVYFGSPAGFVGGESTRFDISDAQRGVGAWLASASSGQTHRVGLWQDPEFTSTDGEQYSSLGELNDAGYAQGASSFFDGNSFLYPAIWLASATSGQTQRAGVWVGAEFFDAGGNNYNQLYNLTSSGFASGVTTYYVNNSYAGDVPWVASVDDSHSTRVGLWGGEFTDSQGYSSSFASVVTESGFLSGASQRYDIMDDFNGQAVWVARASTGDTDRVGFFGTAYTRDDDFQSSSLFGSVGENGYVGGSSNRYSGADFNGVATWFANAADGSTTRIGFWLNEFSRSDDYQNSSLSASSANGIFLGESAQYDSFDNVMGYAVWLARAETGVTERLGLFGAEYTTGDGAQYSYFNHTSAVDAGLAYGTSLRGGDSLLGLAVWAADLDSGTTTRIGLFGAGYADLGGYEYSDFTVFSTEGQFAGGDSDRYDVNTGDSLGAAAWVANGTTGTTQRVGLTGAEFTFTDGAQYSDVSLLLDNGFAAGSSQRADWLGQGAWVADGTTGVTVRVGLTGAEFTSDSGNQNSSVSQLLATGFARGDSTRYDGDTAAGSSPWIASFDSGNTTRVGLSGGLFSQSDGSEYNYFSHFNAEGYAAGFAQRYDDNFDDFGAGAWLASATTQQNNRVGFWQNEFSSSTDYQYSTVNQLTNQGFARGTSDMYDGLDNSNGQATWLAVADTGMTHRVGLWQGPEFTATSGAQFSTFYGQMTESGLAAGNSERYDGNSGNGNAVWVANAVTGDTTRIGLYGTEYTGGTNDFQYSEIQGINQMGLVWGYSNRYDDNDSWNGQTSWIWDSASEVQVDLFFSANSNGYAISTITSLSETGLALGWFELYDANDDYLGDRAFLWQADWGTIVLDEAISGGVLQYGWDYFSTANFTVDDFFVDGSMFFVGLGLPDGSPSIYSGQGIYVMQAIPEPSTAMLLLLAGGAAWLLKKRRRG